MLAPDTIQRVGAMVTRGPGLYYTVNTYVKTSSSAGLVSVTFDHLTWAEVVDVVLASLDAGRPGTQHGNDSSEQWVQEVLG